MDLGKALYLLEKVETELGLVYQHLSDTLRADPEVSKLFSELAADEESHRVAVRYQQRLVKMNPDGFKEIHLNLAGLNEILGLAERVKASRNVSVVDAIKFAKHVETTAGEHHLKNALSAGNPEIANLLQSLGSGDKQHVATLTKLLGQRAGSV
ncbi:MAG: hypothetical protein EHM61_13855 [Acidobacteria bacterium]|nr:MAG: hypothetical protein EHM61_13855 [Acidobacteriota bacterium]